MKWMVYPYSPKFIPVLRYRNLITDGVVAHISAPNGFAISGKDGFIFGKERSGYQIQDPRENDADGIWITPEISYLTQGERMSELEKLDVKDKAVYYSALLEKEEEEALLNKVTELGANRIIHRKELEYKYELLDENALLYKLDTPVIAVAGVGNNTQKFEIQLYLRNELLKLGYNVSQIGTRPYCELLGFHSFPTWMYDKTYTDYEKVIAFNHYIKAIETDEKPEVIILGIPEGIVPFNEKHSQGFGLKAYEVCRAVHPDHLIMALYEGNYTEAFFEEIKNVSKYSLNTEVNEFFISQFSPVSASYKHTQLVFTYSENTGCKKDAYSMKDLENDGMIKKMIEQLAAYDEYEII